jgi:phosphoenolpyruvate---glycerone phosphotransferase subunit DhaL
MRDGVVAWLRSAATRVHAEAASLTALDQAIGDGDHGINLDRGFTAIVAMLDELPPPADDVADGAATADLLRQAGKRLISTVGGASGPLYGTAFRRAGKALGTDEDVSAEALGHALQAALDGVTGLGAAAEGDKTMVDALAPAVRAYQQALTAGASLGGAARAAAAAAEKGAEATIPLQALKGRASYLGPRSVGHQDPGATSTTLILSALADVLDGTP